MITATVPGASDQNVGPYVCFVPAPEMQIRDTWLTLGMRGTESHTFVADELFVPEHRAVPVAEVLNKYDARSDSEPLPPNRARGGPCVSWTIARARSGGGRSGNRGGAIKVDTPIHAPFKMVRVGTQVQIAQAKVMLQTARLHAYDVADALDTGTFVDGDAGYPLAQARARVRGCAANKSSARSRS